MSELKKVIAKIEDRFFRTDQDAGADQNTLMIWNALRREAGMDSIRLPTWCETCKIYHLDHCKPKTPA